MNADVVLLKLACANSIALSVARHATKYRLIGPGVVQPKKKYKQEKQAFHRQPLIWLCASLEGDNKHVVTLLVTFRYCGASCAAKLGTPSKTPSAS